MSRTLSPALTIAAFAAATVASFGSPNPRPNIVLIVSDDHGREAIGCYGRRQRRFGGL